MSEKLHYIELVGPADVYAASKVFKQYEEDLGCINETADRLTESLAEMQSVEDAHIMEAEDARHMFGALLNYSHAGTDTYLRSWCDEKLDQFASTQVQHVATD